MYKTKRQHGEMGYGQPRYEIPLLPKDRVTKNEKDSWDNNKLVIGKDAHVHTVMDTRTKVTRIAKYVVRNMMEVDMDRYVIKVYISCYNDVRDLANYFGKRLPKEFWKEYRSILVKI